MSRPALSLVFVLAACHGGAPASVRPVAVEPEPPPYGVDEGLDVLSEINALNGPGAPAPPTRFNTVGVTPRAFDATSLKQTKNGFAIRFAAGAPITTPAVHDGKVIVSGGFQSQQLYAFDATTGKPAWALDLMDDGPSAAACAEGTCVINTESCTVFAIAAETGALRWSWWLGDPLTSAPAIADGKVFTSYPAAGHPKASHVLAAFDLETGAIVWQKWIDADVMSAPVVTTGTVYASTFAGTVLKIDADTGEIWSARQARATSAPTVADGRVYYSRRSDEAGEPAREALVRQDATWEANEKDAAYLDRSVQGRSQLASQGAALDSGNGFSSAPAAANYEAALTTVGQGSVSTMQTFQGSRVLHVAGTNVSTMGDEVVATDAADGKLLGSTPLVGDAADVGGFLAAPPITAGGRIFVATLDGKLLELDADSGEVAQTRRIDAPMRQQPVAQDGWLYLPTDDGRLIAIDTGDATVTGWSQWGGDAGHTGAR
jgi:outer membrane protein assembly factor BamB